MKLINFVIIIFLALGLLAVPGVVFAQETVSIDSGSIFKSSDSSFLDTPLMKGGGGKGGGSKSSSVSKTVKKLSGGDDDDSDWSLWFIGAIAVIIAVSWLWDRYKKK